jgi:Bacterial RNA polymerase, alpha chain C terminal domain
MQQYSAFFKTLHDETNPTGYLGPGTHYSILRAVVFHDPMGQPLPEGQFADFAVIWDEDHDTRVIEPIEAIYRQGLLSSLLMFGEHKGSFTAIVSDKIASSLPFNIALLRKVDEIEFTARTANCLKNAGIVYLGDLVRQTEAEMLRMPNFGRWSLNEVREQLVQMGLHLGMEVPDWPPENIDALAPEEQERADLRVALLEKKTNTICQSLKDPWPSVIVSWEERNSIIDDKADKVSLYLQNLKMLWQLGTSSGERQQPSTSVVSVSGRVTDPQVVSHWRRRQIELRASPERT